MNSKPQILFVDDERQFSTLICEYLEAKGYELTLHHNAESGLLAFQKMNFDLCIFDVRMPIKDGFTLAEEVRNIDKEIPIVFLSGQTKKEDRIKGLTIGADDYITKPFSMEELFLRIKAILRRATQQETKSPDVFQIGEYSFNSISRELIRNDHSMKLSSIEAKLLNLLCKNQNSLLSREFALSRVWQDDHYLKGRSLNVYVSRLRSFLKQDERIEILNIHGEGYQLTVKH